MDASGATGSRPRRLLTTFGAIAALVVCAAIATALADPKPDPSRTAAEPIEIKASQIVDFDRSRPGQKRFGRLEYRGGLVLTSSHAGFGGWSGLVVEGDGRRFLAISDAGSWLTGEISYEGSRPKALTGTRIGPILGIKGKSLSRSRDRDAEAVVVAEGSLAKGLVLISFERTHRIGRFPISIDGLGAPLGYIALPPEMRRMSANKGLEAICVLSGGPQRGALVALSERYPSSTGEHVGWLQSGAAWTGLSIRNIGGFDLVDCVGLADGSLLVLERRFRWSEVLSGVRSRLRQFTSAEIRAGGLMQGTILLEADMGQEIDNLEGLAVHNGPNGETVLTLISDDNFRSWFQRAILLQFALVGETAAVKAPPK
ncbi:MAG TPA: esterase-like activity of phytase family protein [Hyphomicrobiaceae bacterium]|nr:esterase-like activity of phytase family protein [Hyphomicrobiaceae bacterium]